MTLTSEYQYIGRSNAVKDQSARYSYYILLYAKTSADTATGRHTVTVKQRLVSTAGNVFYGYSTSGKISVAGTTVTQWNWENVPGGAWDITDLTEGGVTYPKGVDLREGALEINVGYGKTKDIVIAGSWTFVSGSAGYLPALNVPAEVSATVTLDKIAGISQPGSSESSVELGQPVTIYTNRIAGAGLTHTLAYQFGNVSGTIAENVGDSTSWTPALDLATQIPNAASGTAVITCTTYASGVAIGSKQMTLTLTVPESVIPHASAVWEDPSGAFALLDTLVQNFSRLSITVSGTGIYGSTIIRATAKLNGENYTGGVLTDAGDLTLEVSVTDSRGRVGTASYTVSVAAYAAPSFTLSASRCTEDGTADDTGDHAIITVAGYVTQVNDRNASELTLTWGGNTETVSLPAGDIAYQKLVYADPNASMNITAQLSDLLVSAGREMILSTGYATLDLLKGGKGISFGKAATREGFDCAMPAYFTGGISIGLEAKSLEAYIKSQLLDMAYPVGSIYLAYNHTNPATLFGGTWERLENAFLLAVDAKGTIGETGGEATHILTASEMPSHTHGFQYSQDNGATYKAASMGKDGSLAADYYLAASNSVTAFADYRVRIAPSGDGTAHNNMPPYIQISAWRRTA